MNGEKPIVEWNRGHFRIFDDGNRGRWSAAVRSRPSPRWMPSNAAWSCTPSSRIRLIRMHLLSHLRRSVYRTTRRQNMVRPQQWNSRDVLPEKYPEFGQCVHKIVLTNPGRAIVLQKPRRAVSIDNAGIRGKISRAGSLGFWLRDADAPARCGLRVHRAGGIGRVRCTPEGHLCVYRTERRRLWEALDRGLPQKGAIRNGVRMPCPPVIPGIRPDLFWNARGKLYGSRTKERVGRK